jgi:hypothetical protein
MGPTDEELKEALSEPWRHATMHAFNVDEHDDLWRECEALQSQIDELYKIVLKLRRRS